MIPSGPHPDRAARVAAGPRRTIREECAAMPRIDTSLTIRARPETIFPWLVEPDRVARWLGGFVGSELLTEGGVRVGARSRDVVEEDGRRTTRETEIVELEPGRRLGVRITSDVVASVATYELRPDGEATRLRYTSDVTFVGLRWMALGPLLLPRLKSNADRDLAALRRELEADPTP
jgi:uncharacterized protein YndB with AHSA1/START domain